MTIKEAIIELEDFLNSPIGDGDLHMESVEVALDALCEQAEREKGCEYCNEAITNLQFDYINLGVQCTALRRKSAFCPMCGKRLKEV